LRKFKDRCVKIGWRVSEEGDCVKMSDEYHVFAWCRSMSPGTLRSIATSSRFSIREQDSWKVEEANYMAFISVDGFSDEVFDIVKESPEFLNRVMLYDIDHRCKIGEAIALVFAEFERFLEEEYGVQLKLVRRVYAKDGSQL